MYRMPYRAMCSRETNRLPVMELQRKLGRPVPNIENGRAASEEPSDAKYVIYLGAPWEFGIGKYGDLTSATGQHFALVEVNGLEENVLEQGCASYTLSFWGGTRPFAKFEGKGEKLGLFAYYCSSPRAVQPRH